MKGPDQISKPGFARKAPRLATVFASLPARGDPRIAYESHVVTHLFRSTDGGLTWSEPVLAPFVHNADLVVDWTGGPYHGHIYAVGVRVQEEEAELRRRHVSLVVSADSGRTYAGPVDMFVPKDWYQGHVGAPVVHPDGRVLAPVGVQPRIGPRPPLPRRPPGGNRPGGYKPPETRPRRTSPPS